jgi:transcription factor TFIIIB component B''
MKTLMEQKKYGRDETGDIIDTQNPSNSVEVGSTSSLLPKSSNPAANTAPLDDAGGGFDYSQDLATSRFNVQVRIGPNGETIIDEESLVVDRAEAEDTENYTHVVESDNTKFVNSGSYGKRFRGSRWSAEETESFYDVSAFLTGII